MPNTTLIPSLRYQNAVPAIDFLCRAFGFTRHLVVADDHDPTLILHAQLALNGNMIMLGSARPGPLDDLYRHATPAELGGITMSLYIVTPDPDAHAAIARAAGAEIVRAPYDNEGYPGRSYNARDPEGYAWSFGSYDPWQG